MTKRLNLFVSLVLLFVLAIGVSPAHAAQDRRAPTQPKDLRVTGMTAHSVTLAWTPSTDNSGSVSYKICCANVNSETFPGPASTHVYRAGLQPGYTYTLRIYAFDAAGNYSKPSNDVTFTLPSDVTPPSKPVVSVTDIGHSYVSLAWSSVDDGPRLWFNVYLNGSPFLQRVEATSGNITPLQPETTYTFTVQARDGSGNLSLMSDPITVTTDPAVADTEPPTTPGNLRDNGMSFEDGETWLFWDESTDNVDPQFAIRYDIYVNGAFDHSVTGYGQTIVYGNAGVLNTYQVIAVDSAGNESAPASITTCAGAIC